MICSRLRLSFSCLQGKVRPTCEKWVSQSKLNIYRYQRYNVRLPSSFYCCKGSVSQIPTSSEGFHNSSVTTLHRFTARKPTRSPRDPKPVKGLCRSFQQSREVWSPCNSWRLNAPLSRYIRRNPARIVGIACYPS